MNEKIKICCIFNLAPHYREGIYRLMDEELGCHFYFGDRVDAPIQEMDFNTLKGFKKVLRNKPIPNTGFEYQKGAWKTFFKPYKYYIITGSPGSISNWFLVIASKFTGKKILAWTHGLKGDLTKNGNLIAKSFYKLCDYVLLYSNHSKEQMLSEGFDSNKLKVIYNSLDYQKQSNIRSELKYTNIYKEHFKNDYPVVIYIGRLLKSKKLPLLIEATHRLNQEGCHCNLVFIGPKVGSTDIHSIVEKYDLKSNTLFYGPTYNEEEIGELIYNADICVSPGSIGLTALHAATYGIPIITHDNFNRQMPEHEIIQEGFNGGFFKEDNMEDLLRVMKLWLGLNEDQKEQVRFHSYSLIDTKYNPNYQIKILKDIILSKR